MYITNRQSVAKIAQKYGIDWIFVDLETLGKEERQKNLNSVKSKHSIADVIALKDVLTTSELLVRVNPINPASKEEIDDVINAGADIIMLPMWKSKANVETFLKLVDGRVKAMLLLETKEANECLDEVLELPGINYIHIGLNDLHLSYGLTFMFELLSNGTVEQICNKIRAKGIPYGFGGIARIGEGILPAEKILLEHFRLGSTQVILSRSFCNADLYKSLNEIEEIFCENVKKERAFEVYAENASKEKLAKNKEEVAEGVKQIVNIIKSKNNGN